jgi:hypothetical protein
VEGPSFAEVFEGINERGGREVTEEDEVDEEEIDSAVGVEEPAGDEEEVVDAALAEEEEEEVESADYEGFCFSCVRTSV